MNKLEENDFKIAEDIENSERKRKNFTLIRY